MAPAATANDAGASDTTTTTTTVETTTPSKQGDTAAENTKLAPRQIHALFDILSHHETYAEIEAFKLPGAVTNYGFPFARETKDAADQHLKVSGWQTPTGSESGTPGARTPVRPASRDEVVQDGAQDDDDGVSGTPLLQTLLTRLVLPLPGMRDLPRHFWAVSVQGILSRLAGAELSESYDKGALGTRKTLATGASALLEMLGRGAFGGWKKVEGSEGGKGTGYDRSNPEDLERAWNDVVDGMIYGDFVEEMSAHLVKTDDVEAFSPAVKAAAEYIIIHTAAFLHHVFVKSPEGQYLIKLVENVHNLVPYKMVKQTLRVGNAATMINGMMRLLLAKISLGSITNWVGLTSNADDGMNLLQRIISLVLSWDAGEFKKITDRVEKGKEVGEDVLGVIREYVSEGRMEHDSTRQASLGHEQSIITVILNAKDPELTMKLTDGTVHAQCLEYYSALLSMRDRDAITSALCRQTPDLFTQMIRDAVTAYEPIIRTVHTNIDLKDYLEDTQNFLDEFIKASKPKKVGGSTSGMVKAALSSGGGADAETRMAGVEDYVELLMKYRGVIYRWCHAISSRCPDILRDMQGWSRGVFRNYREDTQRRHTGERLFKMEDQLNELFVALPTESKSSTLLAIDAHAAYLETLATQSHDRFTQLLSKSSSSVSTGPGVYLARWHDILDDTLITPETPHGAVRHGQDVKHTVAMGKTGASGNKGAAAARESKDMGVEGKGGAPDVKVVVVEMGMAFKAVLQEIGGPEKKSMN